jgi:hypothetical protein
MAPKNFGIAVIIITDVKHVIMCTVHPKMFSYRAFAAWRRVSLIIKMADITGSEKAQ